MDTDINNYSTDDLLTILNLSDEPTEQDIISNSNKLIDNYTEESNTDLANFFIDVQNTLLDEYFPDTDDINDHISTQKSWFLNEQAIQPNKNQSEKITNRKQQVSFLNTPNSSVMNRNQLGINNDYNIPVVQGTINPNLKNTTLRTVVINSSYRQNILPYSNNPNATSSATNFTCNLSTPLTNVLELTLYSIQIPLSWYAIDCSNSTNCFLIELTSEDNVPHNLPIVLVSGNYTNATILVAINTIIQSYIVEYPTIVDLICNYNPLNGKFDFTYSGSDLIKIIFFDNSINLCSSEQGSEPCSNPCSISAMSNNNLGWFLGYRNESYIMTTSEPLIAEAVYDIYGTKNIYIILDDYNHNRLNKGLIGISETETTLSLPSYFSNDLNCVMERNTVQYVPDAPRKITQAQLYSLNEIIKGRENTTKTRNTAPTTADFFAIIPIERKEGETFGKHKMEFSGALNKNQRTYFGPVDIDRLGVRLMDDNGNTMNLNGNDWSFTIIVESLYQY